MDPSYEDRPAAGAVGLLNHGRKNGVHDPESRAKSTANAVINREARLEFRYDCKNSSRPISNPHCLIMLRSNLGSRSLACLGMGTILPSRVW